MVDVRWNLEQCHQSARLYLYSTVPYSTASQKTRGRMKIQYSTQYSRNTVKHSSIQLIWVTVPYSQQFIHFFSKVRYDFEF